MEYGYHLLIVLIATRVLGWAASRLGQPALVGEILAGVFRTVNGPDPIVSNLFSALVLTAVVTTLMTPALLRWILRGRDPISGG